MSNQKKSEQLGMSYGKANNILKKNLLFSFAQKTNMDKCFQCGEKIESIDNFSIEHKKAWLDSENPKDLFFDLDNIAFSHTKCNFGARRKPEKTAKEKNPLAYAGMRIGRSGFKGVSMIKGKSHQYQAYIRYNGSNLHIKYGNDPVELAKLHDKKALELFGEEAITNKKLGLL